MRRPAACSPASPPRGCFGDVPQLPQRRVGLLLRLGGVAAIGEHRGTVRQHHGQAGAAGEAGQPGQPLAEGGTYSPRCSSARGIRKPSTPAGRSAARSAARRSAGGHSRLPHADLQAGGRPARLTEMHQSTEIHDSDAWLRCRFRARSAAVPDLCCIPAKAAMAAHGAGPPRQDCLEQQHHGRPSRPRRNAAYPPSSAAPRRRAERAWRCAWPPARPTRPRLLQAPPAPHRLGDALFGWVERARSSGRAGLR